MTPGEQDTQKHPSAVDGLPAHPVMVGMPTGFPREPEEPPGRLLPGILHALRRRWLLIAFLGSLLGSGGTAWGMRP